MDPEESFWYKGLNDITPRIEWYVVEVARIIECCVSLEYPQMQLGSKLVIMGHAAPDLACYFIHFKMERDAGAAP